MEAKQFTFEISLSVLNHLGRNLYRNFITVLGEAVSNSWDADADNVWIDIDRNNNNFAIKDDGYGMNTDDFQGKFLRIGYSKRKDGQMRSPNNRPYIGAKGIGKLALLSSANRISIISKTASTEYVGGVIDNSGLDEAIKQEMRPDQYPLGAVDLKLFDPYTQEHSKGTIIYFEQTKEDIRNTIPYLRKLIALYFRFSLVDKSFNIFVNNEKVTLDDIKDLSDATEFLWNINNLEDPYISTLSALESQSVDVKNDLSIKGFIATVKTPRNLKITGAEEKIGVDLFVNGRLRERDLLKRIPTARIAENYMYGQIHFDELDTDGKDRFTSSREAIVASDGKYQDLLKELKDKIIPQILDEWDKLRLSRGKDGDDENTRKTKRERRAVSLYNLSSGDYADGDGNVNKWIKELQPDAEFNIPAYVDCFLSENLVRKYIQEENITISDIAQVEVDEWKSREVTQKQEGNINISIRRNNDDLNYLDMTFLVRQVDTTGAQNTLYNDAKEYRPIRNGVMHTALLTDEAKNKLTTIYANIRARVKTLLS